MNLLSVIQPKIVFCSKSSVMMKMMIIYEKRIKTKKKRVQQGNIFGYQSLCLQFLFFQELTLIKYFFFFLPFLSFITLQSYKLNGAQLVYRNMIKYLLNSVHTVSQVFNPKNSGTPNVMKLSNMIFAQLNRCQAAFHITDLMHVSTVRTVCRELHLVPDTCLPRFDLHLLPENIETHEIEYTGVAVELQPLSEALKNASARIEEIKSVMNDEVLYSKEMVRRLIKKKERERSFCVFCDFMKTFFLTFVFFFPVFFFL